MSSEIPKVLQALQHQQLVAYLDVVSASLFLYDYLLTLPMEIALIWPSKWCLLKMLYIAQRYTPFYDTLGLVLHHQFALNLSPTYCLTNYKISGWSYISSIAISEVILALRLWAIYDQSHRVALWLAIFFLACWIPNFTIMGHFLKSMGFAPPPIPYPGCFIIAGSPILAVCWILMMIYDAGNVVMMSLRGYTAYRSGGNSHFLNVVYRDGIIYYFCLFLVSTVNVVVINILPPDLVHLLSSFERILHSILTSRIVLHIREVGSMTPASDTQNPLALTTIFSTEIYVSERQPRSSCDTIIV